MKVLIFLLAVCILHLYDYDVTKFQRCYDVMVKMTKKFIDAYFERVQKRFRDKKEK